MLKTILRVVLAVAFVGAGINHFVKAPFYIAIMPPYLPAHGLLVSLSGIAEIVIGGLLFVNLHMALHPELFADHPLGCGYVCRFRSC